VRLIAAQFVKAYRKSQKNDFNDAEAIAEAVTRGHMRFVPVASVEQSDLQAMHRVREQLTADAVRFGKQIRAFRARTALSSASAQSGSPRRYRRSLPM
jgi:transposase